jgi:peptidoglycan/LPS O-acetylase OafA/YrhL
MEDNLAMWSLLVGSLLPPVMSFIMQPGWSRKAQAFISAAICVLVGAITVYLAGDFKMGEELVTSILLVLISAQTTYRNFWKPTSIAPAIEKATSPGQ